MSNTKKPQIQRSFLEDKFKDKQPSTDMSPFEDCKMEKQSSDVLSESQEDLLAKYYLQYQKRKSQDHTSH